MNEQIQYIGARYVIKIYENKSNPNTAEWDSNTFYEPLTMVTHEYNSYLSKKAVPATVGNPAANPEYWAQTGYYSGQIMELQSHVSAIESALNTEISVRESSIRNLSTELNDEIRDVISSVTAVNNALDEEITNRQNADNAISSSLSTTNTNLATETTARISGDASLQTQIDELIAPSGEAPNPSEIENARISGAGVTYATLGNSIRKQIQSVDGVLDATVLKHNTGNLTVRWHEGGYYNRDIYVSDSDYSFSDAIEVEPNEIYTTGMYGATDFVSFYDESMNPVLYGDNVPQVALNMPKSQVYDKNDNAITNRYFFVVPNNVKYIRYSCQTSNCTIRGLLYKGYWTGVGIYPPYNDEQEEVETINHLTEKETIYGYYMTTGYNYGRVANGRTTPYIPYIDGGYIYNTDGGIPVVIYDSDKNVVETYASANAFNNAQKQGAISSDAAYIKFYHSTNYPNGFYGACEMPYGWIPKLTIPYGSVPKELNVSYDATEVSSLASALHASFVRGELLMNIPLNIYIDEGTYDFTSLLNFGDLTDTYGLTVGKNTHLKGKHNKHQTVLQVKFADNESGSRASLLSVLNVNADNATIENVTIVAKNCRYCVHDDSNNGTKGIHNKFTNVDFIHEGNNTGLWNYPSAFGMGTSEDSEYIFTNCMFKSPFVAAGFHSNQGESKDTYVEYNKCQFISTGDTYSFSLDEYNTNESGIDHLQVADCFFSPSNIAYRPVASNPFDILGYINGSGSPVIHNLIDSRESDIVVV